MKTKNITKTTDTKKEKKVEMKFKHEIPFTPKYELISFSVKATIPTMSYGNIIPEIVVKTKTIEEAKSIVLPVINQLFDEYAEKPLFSRATVTVEERKVETPIVTPPANIKKPIGVLAEAASIAQTPKEEVENLAQDLSPKSPAFLKASSAVNSATSLDALNLIEDQIHKSVKLTDLEKPVLLTEVLKKRKEF